MQFRVLLFGGEAVALACDHVVVDLPDPPTCGALRTALAESHPALRSALASGRLAVNHEFAATGQTIHPDDEIALIGLVGGG
jgi:molybdopterin converting factor small subunit